MNCLKFTFVLQILAAVHSFTHNHNSPHHIWSPVAYQQRSSLHQICAEPSGGKGRNEKRSVEEDEITATLMQQLEQMKHRDYIVENNWRTGQFQQHILIGADQRISAMKLSNSMLAVASELGDVHVMNLATGQIQSEIFPHRGAVSAMHWDGNVLITAGADNYIRVLPSPMTKAGSSGRTSLVFKGHLHHHIMGLVRLDPNRFASAGTDGKILIWDHKKSPTSPVMEIQAPDAILCLDAAGDYITAGLADGRVVAYSSISGHDLVDGYSKALLEIQAHNGPVTSLHFNEQNFLATGGKDGVVRLWNILGGGDHGGQHLVLDLPGEPTKKLNRVYKGHPGSSVTAVQADNKKIISTSLDGHIKAWCIETGEEFFSLRVENNEKVLNMQFDSTFLITDGHGKHLILKDFSPSGPSAPIC
mmetsp:Transcript_24673/g.40501  ORF Transcript_24673/g.40501 Transcript_24673/m.40501 type:complete len:417 (-) Transcript_24673:498-1748(-)